MYGYKLTPAEKARETRLKNLAHSLVEAIDALPWGPDRCAEVPRVFREAKGSPELKADAFRWMDEQPGRFPGYRYPNNTGWHGTLRQCRNHPVHGRELFAIWARP